MLSSSFAVMSLEVGFRIGPGRGRPRFSSCHVRQSGGLVIAAGQPGVRSVMHLSRRTPTRRFAPPASLSPATGSRCALLAFQPERTPADELQLLPFEPFAKLARYRVFGIEGVGALARWKESRPLLSDGVPQTIPLGNGKRTYSSEQRYHSVRWHSSTGCARGWPRKWVRWASATRAWCRYCKSWAWRRRCPTGVRAGGALSTIPEWSSRTSRPIVHEAPPTLEEV